MSHHEIVGLNTHIHITNKCYENVLLGFFIFVIPVKYKE
jgi:hypothetical protein